MKFRATIVAAGLAATAALGGVAATANAAPHGNPLAACQKWANTHTFAYITKATDSKKAGLTISGYVAKVHCGGPDDMQYVETNKAFTGHLLPKATINVLTFNNGIQSPRLSQAKFPHWVATDHNSGVYTVTGPFKAIRAIAEQYHP